MKLTYHCIRIDTNITKNVNFIIVFHSVPQTDGGK
jgi:hypothetical protein